MTCPKCGANVPPGSTSCGSCGARFRTEVCPNCGRNILAGSTECMYCHKKIKRPQSAAPGSPQSGGKAPKKNKPKGAFRWWQIPIAILIFLVGVGVGTASNGGTKTKESNKKTNSASSSSIESNVSEDSLDSSADKSDQKLYEVTYQTCDVYTNSINNVCCKAIIEIENTSDGNIYLDYPVFEFEDKNGKLLGTCDTFTFGSADPKLIAPGEKAYFYSNGDSISGTLTPDMEYVFVPKLTVKESKNKIIRYDLSDLSISESQIAPCTIIGRVTNNTDKDDSLVWISFVLFNANEQPIGVFGTNITDLKAGDTASFSAEGVTLPDGIKYGDIADYKVYAEKTQFQF